jgi:tRNA pseudouridine32 synthase/23S rRNA pseudouridine746 synthase
MSATTDPAVLLRYADDALLVFDKPSGLLSVPGRGADKHDSLATRAQALYADARIVHRLDMGTSGLMLMARGAAAQRALSMAFAARTVAKAYVALVAGRLVAAPEESAVIDLPIRLDWPARPRRIVDPLAGKPSLTRWRALDYDAAADATRVALEPLTGRSHQLRVHLAAIGHPILGDALYAPPALAARAARLMLHAHTLCFAHPLDGRRMCFTSGAPF